MTQSFQCVKYNLNPANPKKTRLQALFFILISKMLFHRGKASNDRDRSVDKTPILRLPVVFFSLTMALFATSWSLRSELSAGWEVGDCTIKRAGYWICDYCPDTLAAPTFLWGGFPSGRQLSITKPLGSNGWQARYGRSHDSGNGVDRNNDSDPE